MVPAPRSRAVPGRQKRLSPAVTLLASLALAGCATAQHQADAPAAAEHESAKNSTRAMLRLAARTESSGNPGAARDIYAQIVARHPEAAAGHLGLGRTSYRTGTPAEAAQHYRTALTYAPGSEDARYGLGKALLAADRPEAAIEQFDRLIAQKAADTRPYVAKGVALDMLGRHADAQDVYRRGLEIAPMNVALRTNLGLSLALGGDYKTALPVLEDAARDPKATARTRQNLALVYGLAGEMDDAAATGSADLGQGAVQRNLAYYRALRQARAITQAAANTRVDPEGEAPPRSRTQVAGAHAIAATPRTAAPRGGVSDTADTRADAPDHNEVAEPAPEATAPQEIAAAPVTDVVQIQRAPVKPKPAPGPEPAVIPKDEAAAAAEPAKPAVVTPEPVVALEGDSPAPGAGVVGAGVVEASFSPAPAPDHVLDGSRRSYWVQVASLRSEGEAKTEWARLKDAHATLLAQLPLNLQKTELPEKGTYYRLRSGPFAEAGTPKQLCEALQARNQACLVLRREPQS